MNLAYVLGAAIIHFLICGIWYGAFKKTWLVSWKLEEKDLRRNDPKPYLIAFIGSVWASYGVFLLLKHIRPQSVEELLATALGTWLFILVGLGGKHYSFARVSGKAFAIDYGVDLIGLIIMSLIINNAI